jgi:hypothetical protein
MLYHYTTAGGLLGIAESKSLWATNIRYLNDATEYLHAVHIARRLRRETFELSSYEEWFFDYLLGESEAGAALAERRWGADVYVASLSRRKDRLSQWRAYARNQGYCIGWEQSALDAIAPDEGFRVMECIYDPSEQQELILPLLRSALEGVRAVLLRPKSPTTFWWPDSEDKEDQQAFESFSKLQNDFDVKFAAVAAVCKNPEFEEEEESRLIATRYLPSGQRRELQYRQGKSLLVPYTRLSVRGIEALPAAQSLTTIYCGPNPEPSLARMSVLRLFSEVRRWPQVKVIPSSIPYRNWD